MHTALARINQTSARFQAQMPVHAHASIRNILRDPAVQSKLKVGAANDPAEREADAVADRVMHMRLPRPGIEHVSPIGRSVQRLCAGCKDELEVQRMATGEGGEVEEELIQPKEKPGATPALSAASEGAIRGLDGGAPLARSERAFFEPRFGRDLSDVRIHTGVAADQSARSINARAYTLGSEIAFARGEYTPGTPAGRRLMAHELTHVVQQSGEKSHYGTYLQRSCQHNSDESFYQNSPIFCRDTGFTGLLHPGRRCYREVPKRSSYFSCPPGEQVCFDDQGACEDSPDKVSPVERRDSDGSCNLHFICSLGHGVVDVIPPILAGLVPNQRQCIKTCKDEPWYTRGFCLSGCTGGRSFY